MINLFVLEGKLKEVSDMLETDRGTKFMKLVVSVQRNFRNSNGEYEEDEFDVELWRGVAESFIDKLNIGKYVSVQGRVQSTKLTSNEGKEFIVYKFIGEKVTCLY